MLAVNGKYTFAFAYVSDDEMYRYNLIREWDPAGATINFVMMNPSTADARQDDPTTRMCVSIAKYLGFGRLVITNLFAYRSPDPSRILRDEKRDDDDVDYVGEYNDDFIDMQAECATMVVLAWGNQGARFPNRVKHVLDIMHKYEDKVQYIFMTSQKQPAHPRALVHPRVSLSKFFAGSVIA